jgi:hypothetical protein
MHIDPEAWLHAVCDDPLTTQSAGKVACELVRGFKNSSGSHQVSFERLADLSGVKGDVPRSVEFLKRSALPTLSR